MKLDKILIVEDDPDQILLYKTEFEVHNYEVMAEVKSAKTLERARKFQPDIIIMDLLMEEQDGLEVLEKLKADQELKNIPVLIFSNYEKQEKGNLALKLGAEDFIIKSKTMPRELVQRVADIINKYQE